jgi:hypothetical protein
MTAMAGNLFDQLRPALPATEGTEQEKTQSIERLLNWLVNNWPKSQITMRQICDFGPYPLRNKPKAVVELARDLEAKGWLIPLRPRRHDSRAWKIGFKPNGAQ